MRPTEATDDPRDHALIHPLGHAGLMPLAPLAALSGFIGSGAL